jgi:hypothetical protein
MDLFINSTLEFEKVSGEATLPEDPNAWQNEVLQELFKQVPYVSDFEPHVVMDKIDAERGYGFGHVEVSNKTEVQPGTSAEGMQAAGVKHVKIPVIIKNRRLQPFDVMVTEDGKVVPLTEPRLRAAIFRPSAFDITGRTPGDMSMVGQLYPPFRQNFGMGGGVGLGGESMGKMGSATSSLLEQILPTISQADYNAFTQKFASKQLQAAYAANGHATSAAIQKLASWQPVSHAAPSTTPDVVQVRHNDDGTYTVKSASHTFWAPKEETWDRGQVCRVFGTKIAFEADTAGSVTMATGQASQPMQVSPEEDKFELVKDFGLYKVCTDDGKELVGYVFPNLIDIDGTPLPLCLFTNGSQKALQGEISGVSAGQGAALFEGQPRGTGCFYEVLNNGKAQATVPMTIVATLQNPGEEGNDGVVLHARTFDGRQVEIEIQPNLMKVTGVSDEKMLVPDHMNWLPLDRAEDVSLLSTEGGAEITNKMASVTKTIEIRCGGPDCFSFSGAPLTKVASQDKNFLSYDESIFLLGGLGVNLEHANAKLAAAMTLGMPIGVEARQNILTQQQMAEGALKFAAAALNQIPDLRVDLVKEAASIPDPSTVDTVLSLGFINSENLLSFIGSLPKLDESQKKLCELLLAARLGLRELPISALEKAIRAVEEVIVGLKSLAFQQA